MEDQVVSEVVAEATNEAPKVNVSGGETGGSVANAEGKNEAPAFKAPESQEAFDKIIQDRLARERAKYADYEDLKKAGEELAKIKDSQKTDSERVNDRLAEYEKNVNALTQTVAERDATIKELQTSVLRSQVAAEKGVPAILADRLRGDTAEALAEDAERLLESLNVQQPPASGLSTRPRQTDSNAKITSDDANFDVDAIVNLMRSESAI